MAVLGFWLADAAAERLGQVAYEVHIYAVPFCTVHACGGTLLRGAAAVAELALVERERHERADGGVHARALGPNEVDMHIVELRQDLTARAAGRREETKDVRRDDGGAEAKLAGVRRLEDGVSIGAYG